MIVLHKFTGAWELPDISPFCIKVETYLRMMGLEYQTVVSDSRKAPKRKCPYIEHNGSVICDSSAIITYLEGIVPNALDHNLAPRQKAISAAFKGMIEEHLYFVIFWLRWIDPSGWQLYKPIIYNAGTQLGVPSMLHPLIAGMLRKQYRRTIWGQGTGRHSREEISAIGVSHVRAISDWLGAAAFMHGDEPSTIDASVYGFIASIVWAPFEGPLKAEVQQAGNLVAYCERMKARYWSGYVQQGAPADGLASASLRQARG